MIDYNLRFERLLNRFEGIVAEECALFQGKLPKEELYATALIGLFYADITYSKDLLSFEKHTRDCIRKALQCFITKNRSLPGCVSLNQKIGNFDQKVEAIDIIEAPKLDWELGIIAADFIARQGPKTRDIARELWGNATIEDIMLENNLTRKEMDTILFDMRCDWEVWNGS